MAPAFCEKSPCAVVCRGLPSSRAVTDGRKAILTRLLACHGVCVLLAVFATLGALESRLLRVTHWSSVTLESRGGGRSNASDATMFVGFNGVFCDRAPVDGFAAWKDFNALVRGGR